MSEGSSSAADQAPAITASLQELSQSLADSAAESPSDRLPETTEKVADWFVQDDRLTEWQGLPAKAIKSSNPDPRLRRLELKLLAESACESHAMEIQDELGLRVSSIHVDHELIEVCHRESKTVTTPLPGGGYQDTVHQLLVFDDNFQDYVQEAVQNKEITERLKMTTFLSGIVLTSVTFLYGTFSLLSFWKRPKKS